MNLRKAFFWLHLAAGVVASVVILSMAFTGSVMAYQRQIIAWSERNLRSSPPSWEAVPLDVETLITKVRAGESNAVPTGLTLRSEPGAPASISFGRDKTLVVDTCTGAVIGDTATTTRGFFKSIVGWHRWLGQDGAGRDVGKAITGAANLALLFLGFSGLILWIPRRWTKPAVRAVTVLNGKLSGKARDWNWHNVVGVWTALPLLIVILTGTVISYQWANALLFRATGTEPPAPRAAESPRPSDAKQDTAGKNAPAPARAQRDSGPKELRTAGLNHAWSVAETRLAGWQSINLRIPNQPGEPLTFLIDQGNGARPDLRATLTLDALTGAEVRWQPYSSQTAGQRARAWARWIHTGEAGGLLGQTAAFLVTLGIMVLMWTGLALTWRRFFGKQSVREANAELLDHEFAEDRNSQA